MVTADVPEFVIEMAFESQSTVTRSNCSTPSCRRVPFPPGTVAMR